MLYHSNLSFNYLKLVYHALIKSRLQYGIVLWGNANQSALKNLNIMHNRAIQYLSMQPYRTRLNKLYAFSKLLKVNELYQYSAIKFMFRLYNDREFKDKIPLVNEIHGYNQGWGAGAGAGAGATKILLAPAPVMVHRINFIE